MTGSSLSRAPSVPDVRATSGVGTPPPATVGGTAWKGPRGMKGVPGRPYIGGGASRKRTSITRFGGTPAILVGGPAGPCPVASLTGGHTVGQTAASGGPVASRTSTRRAGAVAATVGLASRPPGTTGVPGGGTARTGRPAGATPTRGTTRKGAAPSAAAFSTSAGPSRVAGLAAAPGRGIGRGRAGIGPEGRPRTEARATVTSTCPSATPGLVPRIGRVASARPV